jgi:hypothetical protein
LNAFSRDSSLVGTSFHSAAGGKRGGWGVRLCLCKINRIITTTYTGKGDHED